MVVRFIFQLLFIPAGDQSSYCFSGVVDAFPCLCGRFAVISLMLNCYSIVFCRSLLSTRLSRCAPLSGL